MMKKISIILLLVIIMSGCNIVSFPNNFNQAVGKVILNHNEYTMVTGEYEWKENDLEFRKISGTDIYNLADEFNTLIVKKDDQLKFEIEKNPSSITVIQWNEDNTSTEVTLENNEITLPSKEGYYIYEIFVEWNYGKATYVFDIEKQ